MPLKIIFSVSFLFSLSYFTSVSFHKTTLTFLLGLGRQGAFFQIFVAEQNIKVLNG